MRRGGRWDAMFAVEQGSQALAAKIVVVVLKKLRWRHQGGEVRRGRCAALRCTPATDLAPPPQKFSEAGWASSRWSASVKYEAASGTRKTVVVAKFSILLLASFNPVFKSTMQLSCSGLAACQSREDVRGAGRWASKPKPRPCSWTVSGKLLFHSWEAVPSNRSHTT